MKRLFDSVLSEWASAQNAKPMLLRGARQVGKTYCVRTLGRRFRHFVEINFEETPEAGRFFEGALTAAPIAAKLSAFAGKPIRPGESLLFLDEVQGQPRVLASLRYFREQMPGLHVVAAGSLLEFALEEVPSFGVGRVTSRFLYPMTFPEFLDAIGEGALAEMVEAADFTHPLDAVFHEHHLSCITPTDCAKRLVERASESWNALVDVARNISISTRDMLTESRQKLSENASWLQQKVTARIHAERTKHALFAANLKKDTQFILKGETARLDRNSEGLRQGTRKILDLAHSQYKLLELRVKSANPETALAKGYTLTLDASGKFVRNASQLKSGDTLRTKFRDGTVESTVR